MEQIEEKREITLGDLAKQMTEGFAKSHHQYEELAQMTAKGFADVQGQITDLRGEVTDIQSTMATKDDLATLGTELRSEMVVMKTELKTEIEGLRNSINNYLRLSDERYLELKHRQDVIVGWITKLAEQNKLPIDLRELEYK